MLLAMRHGGSGGIPHNILRHTVDPRELKMTRGPAKCSFTRQWHRREILQLIRLRASREAGLMRSESMKTMDLQVGVVSHSV